MPDNPKSKKTIVYENLKHRIIANALKPGDPLNEGALSRELGISKTPIREALQQLEEKGLVESIPGIGAFVSRFTYQDVRELFEIREILECDVIRRLASKEDFDPAKAQKIREEFIASGPDGGRDNRNYFTTGDQIHSFIFSAWGNRKLMRGYQGYQEEVIRITLHFLNANHRQRAEISFREHLEVLDGLIARDPARAERAMRTHLQNSLAYLKSIM